MPPIQHVSRKNILDSLMMLTVYNKIFPNSSLGVELTSGAIDTFGSWFEIISDSDFDETIIVTGFVAFNFSDVKNMYIIEFSIDDGTTINHSDFVVGTELVFSKKIAIPAISLPKNTKLTVRIKSAAAAKTFNLFITHKDC